MYKNYEQQYLEICKNILENGYYDTNVSILCNF